MATPISRRTTQVPHLLAATTVCSQVLGTTELFEAIISYLPVKDVAQSQATSQYWRYMIIHIPSIQRKLFFQPVANLSQLQCIDEPPDLVSEHVRGSYLEKCGLNSTVHVTFDNTLNTVQRIPLGDVLINPFFRDMLSYFTSSGNATITFWARKSDPGAEMWWEQSRARMFVTQPPCVEVTLVGRATKVINIETKHVVRSNSIVKKPNGVTMRDVLSEMERLGRMPMWK